MAEFAVAGLDEIERIEDGRCPFHAVRQHFGIGSFGVNAMVARAAGDRLVNEHDESEPDSGEELYVVISGRATFELDGERRDAGAGTFVYAPPGIKRAAFALDAGTTVLAIGGAPEGKPYRASGWELFAPLVQFFVRGEYAEGAERARALIASDPPYGLLFYNTACLEARAGQTAAALGHLRRAVELSPECAQLARGDADLASLRGDSAFAEIVG
jgi:hypothetical protein